MPVAPWLLLCLTALLPAGPDRRPNVLLVILDDVGTDRVAAYGEAADPGHTPVLDALAAHGVLFRNTWAAPVCSPSRVTMLTGRHGFRTGIGTSIPYDNTGSTIGSGGPLGIPADEISLGWVARRAGYRTAAIGKWHLANITGGGQDHPILMGFERHLGSIGVGSYFDWTKNVADENGHGSVQVSTYATTENVDDALATIEDFGGDPWFVWLSFTSIHTPYHVPPAALLSAETQAELALPDPDPATLSRAMIEAADTELGRLLSSLRPATLANTVVVVVGDNGTHDEAVEEPVINGGTKGSVAEGGLNVPLIMAGAGVADPGREVGHLVCTVDLFATIAELIGAPPQQQLLDGRSLVPVLADPAAPPRRRFAYADKFEPNVVPVKSKQRRAIRDERWKLIVVDAPLVAQPLRFFDLLSDPGEEQNLTASDAPPLTAEQQQALDRLMAGLDDLAATGR